MLSPNHGGGREPPAVAAGLPVAVASAQVKSPPARAATFDLRQDHGGPQPRAQSGRGPVPPIASTRSSHNRLVEWSAEEARAVPRPSWTTSADGKTWTFEPRQGVEFKRPRVRGPDDVKYSYERGPTPSWAREGGYLAIEQIDVADKHTVRITTKQPSATLLAGMAGNCSSIVPREVATWMSTAVGTTGPSSSQEWIPQSHLKARKNPRLPGQRQALRRRGQIKIIPDEGNIIAQLRTGTPTMPARRTTTNYLLVKDDKRLTALALPAPRLRHGQRQPRAEAVHGRAGAPGPRPRRGPHRNPAGAPPAWVVTRPPPPRP